MHPILIAPSILSADFAHLADEAASVAAAGADLLHVDVMDGHFVPNLTIGAPVAGWLKKNTQLPLDCHLMVENPDLLLADFAQAGTTWLSVHVEACRHLHRTVQNIRALGMKPGVALNPHTPFAAIEPILPEVDFVLVMSVNPGFGGQAFIGSMMDKIARLRKILDDKQAKAELEVDGGVKPANIAQISHAGADVFVAGSAVFGASDYAATITEMKRLAQEPLL